MSIYKIFPEEAAWRGLPPGNFVPICRIGGKCAGFRAKTVEVSGHLPQGFVPKWVILLGEVHHVCHAPFWHEKCYDPELVAPHFGIRNACSDFFHTRTAWFPGMTALNQRFTEGHTRCFFSHIN